MSMNDIIFALATGLHTSALHLHRVSGNGVIEKLTPYLYQKAPFCFPNEVKYPYTKYLNILNENNELIDDVMVTFYRNPSSYTGEDLIEITCHGNPIISQNLQSFFRSIQFRDALEGEFTQRAFLNGKLDLSQAEAIRELIHAETQAGVKLSRNQLNGALANEIHRLKNKFITILSYLEAHIDFAPDEVGSYDPAHLIPTLNEILERLTLLKSTYQNGIKLKTGLKFVLCGRPNAGKSTLYNKLLNSDRAIVTEIAGTTRDVLSERLQIENRDFVLMDTAGLRTAKNSVERIGIEKSRQTLDEADIIGIIIDGTKLKQSIETITEYLKKFLSFKNILFIVSKADLLTEKKCKTISTSINSAFPNSRYLFISHDDIDALKNYLKEQYDSILSSSHALQKDAPTLLSARSYDKIQSANMLLEETKTLILKTDLPEKIASNFYVALKTLEEILGEFDIDSVYASIFSTFCIGK